MSGMLVVEAERRLGASGAAEIRMHPFFESLDWEGLLSKSVPSPLASGPNRANDANQSLEYSSVRQHAIEVIARKFPNYTTQSTPDEHPQRGKGKPMKEARIKMLRKMESEQDLYFEVRGARREAGKGWWKGRNLVEKYGGMQGGGRGGGARRGRGSGRVIGGEREIERYRRDVRGCA